MALWKEWAAGFGLLLAAGPRTHCMPGTEWKQCLLVLVPWTHDSMQAVWEVETWPGNLKELISRELRIHNFSVAHKCKCAPTKAFSKMSNPFPELAYYMFHSRRGTEAALSQCKCVLVLKLVRRVMGKLTWPCLSFTFSRLSRTSVQACIAMCNLSFHPAALLSHWHLNHAWPGYAFRIIARKSAFSVRVYQVSVVCLLQLRKSNISFP